MNKMNKLTVNRVVLIKLIILVELLSNMIMTEDGRGGDNESNSTRKAIDHLGVLHSISKNYERSTKCSIADTLRSWGVRNNVDDNTC